MSDTIKRVVWTFLQAFLGAFLVLATGALKAPNLNEAKALIVSAIVAGVAAGAAAVKNLLVPQTSSIR